MDSKPLVSIVIPTYNRATLLPRAIDSVLAQTYRPIELIIVDDGSTDDTPAVLERYRGRLRAITQRNAGASAARNAGVAASRGDYVAFLDSDDLWEPRKLQAQVEVMERAGPAVPCCICNMRLVHADGREGRSFALSLIEPERPDGLWTNVLEVLATRFILFNQAVLVRRAALQRAGAFDESCAYMEDYDLAMRLALEGPWAYVSEPLAVWHEGSAGSLTRRAQDERVELARTIYGIHRKIARLALGACSAPRRCQLAFERTRSRARLVAARLMQGAGPARAAGALLRRAEKLLDLAYTHSPWYPAMKVAALPAATPAHGHPSPEGEARPGGQARPGLS